MLSTMSNAHSDGVLASDLDGLAIPQPQFERSRLRRAAARNTTHEHVRL